MKRFDVERFFLPFLIAAAALTGLGVLLLGLQQSVWFDEVYSFDLARQSWGDIVRLTAQDVHPPLYYWLLKTWMTLFGESDLSLRSMSVLFFSASLVVAGLLLRKFFGTRTALRAMPFIIFAPFLLRYGFEIRMYALASFIGILATYVLVVITEMSDQRKRRLLLVAYGLLVALGEYTLYFMVLVWMAHLVWLMLRARNKGNRKTLLEGIGAYAGGFIVFLPWLPNLLRNMDGGTLSPVTSELGFDGLTGIVTYMFLYRPPWGFTPAIILTILATLVLIGYLAWSGYKQAAPRERQALQLLAIYFAVPIGILLVVTQFLPIYLERYIAHFAIAGYALVGSVAALSLRRADWALRGMVTFLLFVLLSGSVSLLGYGNYNFQRLHVPSIKQVAMQLTDCEQGAVVFADGPQVAVELGYYVTECPVYFFNETFELGGGFTMISRSPYRVASSSELPKTNKIFHVYYNDPKNTVPASFSLTDVVTVEKVSVATYQAR
jgi:mannosyltransferase